MKFYSWDVKEEQNMRFEDPKAVRQIDMGETDLRPEDFWQMPTDSPFSLGGGPQEEWYGPSTPTEEQHFARPPFSSAMPGGMAPPGRSRMSIVSRMFALGTSALARSRR